MSPPLPDSGFPEHGCAACESTAQLTGFGRSVYSELVPFRFHCKKSTMLTLTLKNIPAHLHAKLKERAEKNRRSLNSEILTRLEQDVSVPKVDRTKLANELKAFTDRLLYVDHRIGDRYKRKGFK